VQVAILPAHDHLEDFVKLTQRAIRHLNPSPDRGIALLERHLKLTDRTRLGNGVSFLAQVLLLQGVQEVVDLVEDGAQPLSICGRCVSERGVDLL
jgi:hypothetical protein